MLDIANQKEACNSTADPKQVPVMWSGSSHVCEVTLRYSPVCSRTYTRRFSVPLAHDLITNSHFLPDRSFTGRL